MMRERPISTRGFDMEERKIFKIFRCYALNRLLSLGSFAGFIRCRQLAVLTLLHYGRPLFALLIPHETALTRLYARLRKKGQSAAGREA